MSDYPHRCFTEDGQWVSCPPDLCEADFLLREYESLRRGVEHREGMMEVYDWRGRYAGCIGSETWTNLVMEAKAGAA